VDIRLQHRGVWGGWVERGTGKGRAERGEGMGVDRAEAKGWWDRWEERGRRKRLRGEKGLWRVYWAGGRNCVFVSECVRVCVVEEQIPSVEWEYVQKRTPIIISENRRLKERKNEQG
jgi:hypothetical protein